MSALVISLDFELFWGLIGYRTIDNYRANVEGEWFVVPAILALFKKYNVSATWATVGMLMCKDYKQWNDLRPPILPAYERGQYSAYSVSESARDYPKLFFARPLVEQILSASEQELASHTYSHFSCAQPGATLEQFSADLKCAQKIAAEYGNKPTSLVFPLNQVCDEYLGVAAAAGFTAYRGNPDHWVYRDGHKNRYGFLGKLMRAGDAYLPLTGDHLFRYSPNTQIKQPVNIPASRFLRPSSGHHFIDKMHLDRIKGGMLHAARTDSFFHLWWHPHNFGVNLEQNLATLEELLRYFSVLRDNYGMRSLTMADIAGELNR